MNKSSIILLLCISVGVEISGQFFSANKKQKTKIVVTCDSFQNITDFTNPQKVEIVQNHVFRELWNITIPKSTPLADELKCVLEDMAMKTKVPFWRRYALATTELIFTYLPVMYNINNLCAYAQMVNATVKFLKEKNCPVILNAVQAATVAFTEAGFLLTENGIKLAGCEQCARPVYISGGPCEQNGLIYDFEEIWSLIGWNYPCRLRTVAKKLYYSKYFNDRVMALFTTVVLSEYLPIMESEYEPEPLYKIFIMYTNGKVDKYCCDDFVHEARELSDKIQVLNLEIFDLARKSTGCVGH